MNEFEHGTVPRILVLLRSQSRSSDDLRQNRKISIAQALHHKIDFQHVLGV